MDSADMDMDTNANAAAREALKTPVSCRDGITTTD
jgi:hypothetical protein